MGESQGAGSPSRFPRLSPSSLQENIDAKKEKEGLK